MQVPEIELEFRNGDKQKILPDAKMKIQDIEKIITRVSTGLELKEQIAEMKAAPVTGPVRTRSPCMRFSVCFSAPSALPKQDPVCLRVSSVTLRLFLRPRSNGGSRATRCAVYFASHVAVRCACMCVREAGGEA